MRHTPLLANGISTGAHLYHPVVTATVSEFKAGCGFPTYNPSRLQDYLGGKIRGRVGTVNFTAHTQLRALKQSRQSRPSAKLGLSSP